MAVDRPFLVEITGIAGSGKSTITRLVCELDPRCRRAGFIHARTPRHLAHILGGLPRLLPILVHNLGTGPRLGWAEVKLLAYVTRWRRVLRREAGARPGILVLDQGPVYALVRLKAQGKRVTTTPAFARWWDEMLGVWADELTAVVYLDADDRILWDRINGRAQPHRTKGEPAEVGREFIAQYRRLFGEVLERLERPGGPEVLRLDTGDAAAERLAAEIRPHLSAWLGRDVAPSEGQR